MTSTPTGLSDRERRLEEALAAYILAEEAGQPPDREEWLRRHPDLEPELASFLADRDALVRWAGPPVRSPQAPPSISASALISSPTKSGAVPDHDATEAPQPGLDGLPRPFGDFLLEAELARGGMGVVYRARQTRPSRVVALKMILAGRLANHADVERFRREAEAVASLDHPRIVPIYEVGEHEDHHYYTMKLVGGGDLGQHAGRFRQDHRAAAALMADVARAVHYAHQRGILHRDLKPSNSLLDGEGRSYVADFGLARRIDEESELTLTGAILGTPSYMAPEQARGDAKAVTTAADIYALGGILHRLLTGRPPLHGGSNLEILERLRQGERPQPGLIHPRLDRDLEAICLKCLDPGPDRRYGSADELARDLEHWLRREPIAARKASAAERLRLWCRRNPKLAILAVTTAGLLLTMAVGATVAALALNRLAAQAQQLATAEGLARRQAEESDEKNRWRLVRLDVANGIRLLDQGDPAAALAWFAEALQRDRPDPQVQAMHQARMAATLRACPRLLGLWPFPEGVTSLSCGPDGSRVLAVTAGGTAFLLKIDLDGRETAPQRLGKNKVNDARFSPDGSTLATAGADGQVVLWDRDGHARPRGLLAHPAAVLGLRFTADGQWLVTACEDGNARLWNVASGVPRGEPLRHGKSLRWAVPGPDGSLVATAAVDGSIRIWNVTGKPRRLGSARHNGTIRAMEFSPDGQLLLTAGQDGAALLWRVPTMTLHVPPLRHRLWIFHAAFSPDGKRIVTASHDGTAQVWDAATGERVNTRPVRHDQAVRHAAFSHDGKRLATAGFDGIARVWDAATGEPLAPSAAPPGAGGVRRVRPRRPTAVHGRLGPDRPALGDQGPRPRRPLADQSRGRRADRRRSLWPEFRHRGRRRQAPTEGDRHGGRELAGHSPFRGDLPGGIQPRRQGPGLGRQGRHGTDLGRRLRHAPHPCAEARPCGSPRGLQPRWPATGHRQPGRHGTDLGRPDRPARDSALAAPVARGRGRVQPRRQAPGHRRRRRQPRALGRRHRNRPGTAGVSRCPARRRRLFPGRRSPGGRLLRRFVRARAAYVHDAGSGELLTPPLKHNDGVTWAAFSPDGRRIVTASEDQTARIWDSLTGRPLTPPLRHGHQVWRALFSPDGQRVATVSLDGMARIWDAATGEPLTPRLPHKSRLISAAFTPDGSRLLTGDVKGTVNIWDLPQNRHHLSDAVLESQLLAGHRIDQTGGLVPLTPAELVDAWRAIRQETEEWQRSHPAH